MGRSAPSRSNQYEYILRKHSLSSWVLICDLPSSNSFGVVVVAVFALSATLKRGCKFSSIQFLTVTKCGSETLRPKQVK